MMIRTLMIVCLLAVPMGVAAEEAVMPRVKPVMADTAKKMTDEEFMKRYTSGVEAYIERFLNNNDLYDIVTHDSEAPEEETIIENPKAIVCRKKKEELLSAAAWFYETQMRFAEACLGKAGNNPAMQAYREMVRYYLLMDLAKLAGDDWWVKNAKALDDAGWSYARNYTPFEEGINEHIHGGPSTARCEAIVAKLRESQLQSMRSAIMALMSIIDPGYSFLSRKEGNVTQAQMTAFWDAEAAWDAYLRAAVACHTPVWTRGCGSGTGEEVHEYRMNLIQHHMEMLQSIILFRKRQN